ncbi:hypothetical protein RP20_CCG020555 [Aedes albopictus]|nr:hypothetical protein RP20_CCG020555 [Aedes albopictus]
MRARSVELESALVREPSVSVSVCGTVYACNSVGPLKKKDQVTFLPDQVCRIAKGQQMFLAVKFSMAAACLD